MIGSECASLTCGRCPGCLSVESSLRNASGLSVVHSDLSRTKDETKMITVGFVHDEVQVSVPKIYETVYVMALKELMANNMERLSSLSIQNEIVRIAESIAKLSADKFIQQREK